MMIKVLCLVAFLAVAAFALNPQTGPFTVTPLVSGTTVTGSLPVVDEDDALHLDFYSFYVPENASSVSFTFSNLNDNCFYIRTYLNTFSLPCSFTEYSSSLYQCANSDEDDTSTTQTNLYTPSYDNYLFQYEVNQNWYIGVGRYSSSDYDQNCGYSVVMSYNTTCPGGSVGVATSSTTSECVAYTMANSSATYSMSNVTADFTVFKINVPQNTGNIYVQVNSTSDDLYLYGRSYGAISSSSDAECSTGTSTLVDGMYLYDMFCYTPRQGDFFVVIETSTFDPNWSGSASFMVQTCAANMAGANCSFPLVQFNASLVGAPTSLSIPYAGSDSVAYGGLYFYWDIPANFTYGELLLSADSSQTGYLMIRRDAFPTMDFYSGYEYSSQYESFDADIALNQFDYQIPGRIYFALLCTTTGGCNVTVSGNSTGTSTSSGPMMTTGAVNNNNQTTTGNSTGTPALTTMSTASMATTGTSEDSAAAFIVPSIVSMVAAALFAAL
jgi:hypothetical protein